jgi:CRP/FNR family transcriptional regulator, anaerobic regulatory protein
MLELHRIETTCSSCRIRDLCMPVGLSTTQMKQIDNMVSTRLKIERGEMLYQVNRPFKSLYAIRTGCFKTTISRPDGREQVANFYVSGELLGLDGIASNQYTCNAYALEDSEVCVLHVQQLNDLAMDVHVLQQHVQRIMSHEIVNDKEHLFLLGSMKSDARLASFLINLLTRLAARGQAKDELLLRMTREEIGSYLGLTLETVSRTFSAMAKKDIIAVDSRSIKVLQPQLLHDMAEHHEQPHCQQPVLTAHAP